VAHVFVDDLGRPELSDQDVHHLSRVLRLRAGELVSASDGRGGYRLCEWTGPGAGGGRSGGGRSASSPSPGAGGNIVPLEEPTWEPGPEPALAVAFALTKGEHPEWAVQKLTEAGVDRVIVIVTERCIARWSPENTGRQLVRLREVARLAAMQSRRCWLPSVEGPMAFSELANPPREADGATAVPAVSATAAPGGAVPEGAVPEGALPGRVALAVPGGAPLTLATPTVMIGPEGGWSDDELKAVACHVGLGPHVLRAETAALAAGVLLAALRAGLVSPAS
jgi:16S rRNA (uracil1498-N3)-methyltransferase